MFDLLIAHPLQWLKLRRAIQRLENLDQHLLDDMGIPRRYIADYVSGRRPVGLDQQN